MYEIILTCKAHKTYQKANPSLASKLNRCFEQLSQNPYQHPNIKSLKGKLKGRFRLFVNLIIVVFSHYQGI